MVPKSPTPVPRTAQDEELVRLLREFRERQEAWGDLPKNDAPSSVPPTARAYPAPFEGLVDPRRTPGIWRTGPEPVTYNATPAPPTAKTPRARRNKGRTT